MACTLSPLLLASKLRIGTQKYNAVTAVCNTLGKKLRVW